MSRPASRRTPAHERVVRTLRMAKATIEKLENNDAMAAAFVRAGDAAVADLRQKVAELEERVRISDLRGDVAREHATDIKKVLDQILADHHFVPGSFSIEDAPKALLDLTNGIIARAETAEQESKSIQGLNDLLLAARDEPIQMRLPCPRCNALHVDEDEWATREHSTHCCQHCGECWKPCLRPTVGVRFLPGTKNGPTS